MEEPTYAVRLVAVLSAVALLALSVATAGAGTAGARSRSGCHLYRCTTVAQDRLVRVVQGETREVAQHEAIMQGPQWWVVWRPTGRARPLPGLDPSPSRFAVAGRWATWAEYSCNYETGECGVSVARMDANSGSYQGNPAGGPPYENEAVRRGEAQEPGEPCFSYSTTGASRQYGVTALAVAATGTMAWIQLHHVCEMSRVSRVPVLLASDPAIASGWLRIEDGRVYWKEETVHSSPLN